MKTILELNPPHGGSYPVLCGEDVAAGLATVWQRRWRHAVVVCDDNTERLFGDTVRDALAPHCDQLTGLVLPAGEAAKTRSQKQRLEDHMLERGVDRRGCIVAVGGGVVLDVAGFVAATFMRGIDHVNLATTLLAMVDASVGGKTAINTPAGKNLIGAFHHPRAVLLHSGALESLPRTQLLAGLAEAVKHAVLHDAALFAELERWAALGHDRRLPDELLARCVAIKAEVVAQDDRDSGMRHILNFGHTAAHGIEHATHHATPHGHAVAIGMLVECRVALAEGHFPAADLQRLQALLTQLGLPTEPPCSFAEVDRYLARDKKTEADELRCAIPSAIGRTEARDGRWTRVVSRDALRAAWQPRGGA
jgi:3-dehydroquinate synthase